MSCGRMAIVQRYKMEAVIVGGEKYEKAVISSAIFFDSCYKRISPAINNERCYISLIIK